MKTTFILAALFFGASLAPAADKADKAAKKDPEAIFKKLDANSDGTVTKEEYLGSKKAKKDPDKAAKKFGKLDANQDGKLSKEESAGLAGRKNKGETTTTTTTPAKTEEKKPEAPKPEEKKPADPK